MIIIIISNKLTFQIKEKIQKDIGQHLKKYLTIYKTMTIKRNNNSQIILATKMN